MAGEDEDDVKSIRSHRIKMEISGHSLEESMEECRVEEMSVHKVRGNIWCQTFNDSDLTPTFFFSTHTLVAFPTLQGTKKLLQPFVVCISTAV